MIEFRAKELFSVDLGEDYVLSISKASDNHSKEMAQKVDFKFDAGKGGQEVRPRVDSA